MNIIGRRKKFGKNCKNISVATPSSMEIKNFPGLCAQKQISEKNCRIYGEKEVAQYDHDLMYNIHVRPLKNPSKLLTTNPQIDMERLDNGQYVLPYTKENPLITCVINDIFLSQKCEISFTGASVDGEFRKWIQQRCVTFWSEDDLKSA